MKSRSGTAKKQVLSRYLKEIYDTRLASFARHRYLAIMLRGEYPYVADAFDMLAMSDAETFAELGALLTHLGTDPTLDVRVRLRGFGGGNIDRIISDELERLRGEVDDIVRIYSLTDAAETLEKVEKMRLETSENVRLFERMLLS